MWRSTGVKRRIPVGKTNLYVMANTVGALTAYGSVGFEAKANTDYVVTYKNDVETIHFIVMEEKSQKEVARIESKKEPSPVRNDVFVPIFIPN